MKTGRRKVNTKKEHIFTEFWIEINRESNNWQ